MGPGDRIVDIQPGLWSSPFLYPPIFGVFWRHLASPLGLALRMGAVSVALMGWLCVTLWSGGKGTAAAIALLGAPFAVLLASGNVAGMILVGLSLAHRRNAGVLVGTLGAVKLMPAIVIVWFLATRRYREAVLAITAKLALTLAGVILAGPDATIDYVRNVLPSTNPMGISPAHLLGLPWLTYVILAVGLFVTIRFASFGAAIFTMVFGSPAVGVAGLAQLLAAIRGSGETASRQRTRAPYPEARGDLDRWGRRQLMRVKVFGRTCIGRR